MPTSEVIGGRGGSDHGKLTYLCAEANVIDLPDGARSGHAAVA